MIAKQKLLVIFNKLLLEDSFPVMWRNYDIILLPKPGKNGFRPALSSCVLKLLEKLIKTRLERFVKLNRLLPTPQYGFLKGKPCEDCVTFGNLQGLYKS